MNSTVTRREWMTRTGFAMGGALATGALLPNLGHQAEAASRDSAATVQAIPYAYRTLDIDDVQTRGYRNYFTGGCCYGSFSAIMEHLAATVGAPFDTFPVAMSRFGGGGIAGYGSVCGALLGGAMAFSLMIPARSLNGMITDLFRWYERSALPIYQPAAAAADQVAPAPNTSVSNSHLCHVSVTTWCTQEGVTPFSEQKRERCARLTTDVAGRAAQMLNEYLAGGTFAGSETIDAVSSGCLTCHDARATDGPANVASGMQCTSCHEPH